jgi:hypothetical protein
VFLNSSDVILAIISIFVGGRIKLKNKLSYLKARSFPKRALSIFSLVVLYVQLRDELRRETLQLASELLILYL